MKGLSNNNCYFFSLKIRQYISFIWQFWQNIPWLHIYKCSPFLSFNYQFWLKIIFLTHCIYALSLSFFTHFGSFSMRILARILESSLSSASSWKCQISGNLEVRAIVLKWQSSWPLFFLLHLQNPVVLPRKQWSFQLFLLWVKKPFCESRFASPKFQMKELSNERTVKWKNFQMKELSDERTFKWKKFCEISFRNSKELSSICVVPKFTEDISSTFGFIMSNDGKSLTFFQDPTFILTKFFPKRHI